MRRFIIACTTALFIGACQSGQPFDGMEDEEETAAGVQPLYVDSDVLWRPREIQVCWENPGAAPANERGWVRHAVESTWEANTAIDFVGWGTCSSGSRGIRIGIHDESDAPHTTGLGDDLDGDEEGMVLNFTFKNWCTTCAGNREQSIRWIAVHEFGHALGFAHEQNRPDTPGWCDEEQGSDGDTLVGGWDLSSVMNYCNPNWNNNGQLSGGDVSGLRAMYGLKQYTPSVWSQGFDAEAGWLPSKNPRFLADVNGDGRADVVGFGDAGVYVALSTGTTFGSQQLWLSGAGPNNGWTVTDHPRFLADVNGDGRADVVGFGNAGIYVALSTGSSFGSLTLKLAAMSYDQGWRGSKNPRFLTDVNGDGRADAVGFGNAGVYVALSTGSGFGPLQQWSTKFGYNDGWTVADHPRYLVDVNGDGKTDVAGFGNAGVYVALSTGSSFGAQQQWSTKFGHDDGWSGAAHPRVLADVNGDGKEDVVGFGNTGTSVALSTGSSFGTPQQWSTKFGYNDGWGVATHPRFLADVNGDGRADVVGFGNAGLYVSVSTGSAFAPQEFRLREYGAAADGWVPSLHLRLVGDVNNDGRADVVGFATSGVHVSRQ